MDGLFRSGIEIAADIVADAARIEREKEGQALTPQEMQTVTAGHFLRQIAPYLDQER